MKKINIIIVAILLLNITFATSALAQDTRFDVNDNINLEPITIAIFPQISLGLDQYATIYSWLSFAGLIASIALAAFWVFLILRASFNAIQSEGNEEGLTESFGKIKSTFIGIGLALLFPIAISIIGGLFGLGALWTWPSALRSCPNNQDAAFFFQEVLFQADAGESDPNAAAEAVCY